MWGRSANAMQQAVAKGSNIEDEDGDGRPKRELLRKPITRFPASSLTMERFILWNAQLFNNFGLRRWAVVAILRKSQVSAAPAER